MSWETFNPFGGSAAYQRLAALPLAARVEKLRESSTRDRILSECGGTSMEMLRNSYDTTFALSDGPVYEPDPETSMAARAKRAGVDVDALIYDEMLELTGKGVDGKPGFLHVWFSGYKGGNLDDIGAMMTHPDSVVGLADGGAHCSMICDASMPTYVLEHWVRDRTRGPRLPVEQAVQMLSKDPADLYELFDRGTLEAGKRADINVIHLEGLKLHTPEIANDLPTGAARVVQRGEGFDATLVAGQVTFRNGEDTGARPGGLIRGPQSA
jgi:N-acyl-D-aspartate/D-glutamate deacylase